MARLLPLSLLTGLGATGTWRKRKTLEDTPGDAAFLLLHIN